MVEFLKPTPLFLVTLNVTSDYQNRPAIDLGIYDSCHGMYNAGPTNDQAHSRPSGEVPVSLCSVACTLLISKRNEPNSAGRASLGNLDDGNSNDAKDNVYLKRTERLSDKLSASDFGLL